MERSEGRARVSKSVTPGLFRQGMVLSVSSLIIASGKQPSYTKNQTSDFWNTLPLCTINKSSIMRRVAGGPDVMESVLPWPMAIGSIYSHLHPCWMSWRANVEVISSSLHPVSHRRRASCPLKQPKRWAILRCSCSGSRQLRGTVGGTPEVVELSAACTATLDLVTGV